MRLNNFITCLHSIVVVHSLRKGKVVSSILTGGFPSNSHTSTLPRTKVSNKMYKVKLSFQFSNLHEGVYGNEQKMSQYVVMMVWDINENEICRSYKFPEYLYFI